MTFYEEDDALTDEDNLFHLIRQNEGLTFDEIKDKFLTTRTPATIKKLKKILTKFVNAGYVKKQGRPLEYYLTYDGKELFYNSIW